MNCMTRSQSGLTENLDFHLLQLPNGCQTWGAGYQYAKNVADFDSDPIGFLKEKLSQGNYEGRDKKHNYLLLITLVKIQNALESFNLNLKSRK